MAITRIGDHLGDNSALPQGLVARAMRLHALNTAFVAWASRFGPWAHHVQLANIEAGRVAFLAHSAAALTPLRYRQAEVLAWLSAQTGDQYTQLTVSIKKP